MKKIYRVTSNEDFAKIVHQGKTKKNSIYTIHYLKNDLGFVRIGLSVSKKIGVAVKRNRIKRQIRSMLNDLINFNENSIDVIVVVKDLFLNNDFWQNKENLKSLITFIHGENK